MMQITSEDLYQYGKWARDSHDHLGTTSAWSAIMKGNVGRASRGPSYNITDEVADIIDKAVCHLKHVDQDLFEVFSLHYLQGNSYRTIATHRGHGKTTVANDIHKASGFVLGIANLLADGVAPAQGGTGTG